MEATFRAHPLWAGGCTEEELESAGLAQKKLQKINTCKAPRDKLICILNYCKVITNLLMNASIASNENPPGADEFLPVLIYVTIKASPPHLHSNLQYIERYRRQSRLVAEAAYYLAHVFSAESFISNIDAKSLCMDEFEFEKNMESARVLLSGLATDYDTQSNQTDSVEGNALIAANDNRKNQCSLPSELPATPPRKPENGKRAKAISDLNDCESISKVPSLSELENKVAAILLKEDEPNKTFQEYPYLFAQVGDLTVNYLEDLLNSYKQLAFEYICLSKGLGLMECIENIKSEESVGRRDGVVPGDDDQSLSRSLWNDPV